jgi:hypothetical protein
VLLSQAELSVPYHRFLQTFPTVSGVGSLITSILAAKLLGRLYNDDTTVPQADVLFAWLPSPTGPLEASAQQLWWDSLSTDVKESVIGIVSLDGLDASTTVTVSGNSAGFANRILEALRQSTVSVGSYHSFTTGTVTDTCVGAA